MKKIKLTQGKYALVDDKDFVALSAHKWCVNNHGGKWRAQRKDYSKEIGRMVFMHRVIMKPNKKSVVDHINGNSLDNRRCNLRVCSQSRNLQNQRLSRRNKSGVSGVHYKKQNRKWVAEIAVNRKRKYLGIFEKFKDAVLARKKHEQLVGWFTSNNLQNI